MRSRNGNHAFTLAICALSTLCSLYADEYIISYRSVTQDALLLSETLNVSRAMQPCSGKAGRALILPNSVKNNLEAILRNENERFFDYLRQLPIEVTHRAANSQALNRSTTILRLPPQCFTVDFNDDFVKIVPLM